MTQPPRPSTLDAATGERARAIPIGAARPKPTWEFRSSVDHPAEWTGEGPRCEALWPENGRPESSARCELRPHGREFRHVLSQRV
ncbi:MAG TPA: hypothetical protein VFX15_03060 [Actinomycetes bacterium]|nr:hypothetical protein [Actinomycetes bacterium]